MSDATPPPDPEPNPNPNPTTPDPQPQCQPPPPPSSSSTPPPHQQSPSQPPLNPNPNANFTPSQTLTPPPPPQIIPYAAVPTFRPTGVPPPQQPMFTPMAPHHPPPGVAAPPPQQPQQTGYPGQVMYPGQLMYPGQPQQQQQAVYPGQPQPPQAMRPPPYMPMSNGYMPPGTTTPIGVVRYPFPPMARPGFLPSTGLPVTVPSMSRPPFLIRPPVTIPIVRPILQVIMPAEKPQTTVYVGKIAPSVENDFIRSLLELCGPIKSWKRAQDPSDGTPKRFGFCEFEAAEGVLRALRLLSKCSVDGEELVLNVNGATRGYLERYVKKKREDLNKQGETAVEEAKKEGESATGVEMGEEDDKKDSVNLAEEEPKKDVSEAVNNENDTTSFGLVTDEDRDADQEAREKLTNMIEERVKTKPLPPPPPPPVQKVAEEADSLHAEVPAKSGDKDSDIDTVKTDEKNDDEMTSETKSASRAGTVSPDRARRNDSWGRDRDRGRSRRDENELDRLELKRQRERERRERDRDAEILKAERFYKEQLKEWEAREKDREDKRKYESKKEKDRERERRRLIADQEEDSDDESRKRRRKSDIEDRRRRRRREKEEDLADRAKEEEEIAEAKKRAEEQLMQLEKEKLELPPVTEANGGEGPVLVEPISGETEDEMEVDQKKVVAAAAVTFTASASPAGNGSLANVKPDEQMTSDSPADVKLSGGAPTKKLGFGLVGSGKRTTVPSVFHEEEDDDAQKDKKMRPLVPIDYTAEEMKAEHTNDEQSPPNSVAVAESGRHGNPKETNTDLAKEKSRRSEDKSSHRDRGRGREPDPSGAPKILNTKQLIDIIPKTKDGLFSYEVNWAVYDENRLHERMRPWICKKIVQFLGEEESTLVDFIVDKLRERCKAENLLTLLQQILDEEAEMFVLKLWTMLIYEIKRVETGLVSRQGA